MAIKYFFKIFISFASICLLMSCDDEVSIKPGALPPYTDTGANVLSCLIDGKLFVFKDELKFTKHNHAIVYFPKDERKDTSLFLSVTYYSDTNFCGLDFRVKHISDTGYYLLLDFNDDNKNSLCYTIGPNVSNSLMYVNTKNHIGEMHIKKLDIKNGIISGTFSSKLKIWEYGPEFLTITNGQFDFKYEKY